MAINKKFERLGFCLFACSPPAYNIPPNFSCLLPLSPPRILSVPQGFGRNPRYTCLFVYAFSKRLSGCPLWRVQWRCTSFVCFSLYSNIEETRYLPTFNSSGLWYHCNVNNWFPIGNQPFTMKVYAFRKRLSGCPLSRVLHLFVFLFWHWGN